MGQEAGSNLRMTSVTVFPRLTSQNHRVTSPPSTSYNCIAWAADDTERWWWPGAGVYWPAGVREEETLDAFEQVYASLGYERCDNGDVEDGFEKIAIYEQGLVPTHAARQLPNGRWTSKLGALEDVEHPIDELRVVGYGNPSRYMKRKRG